MIQKTNHIAFSIGLLEEALRNEEAKGAKFTECFIGPKDVTFEQAREIIKGWKAQGYKYVPGNDCDNIGSDGSCLGHEDTILKNSK